MEFFTRSRLDKLQLWQFLWDCSELAFFVKLYQTLYAMQFKYIGGRSGSLRRWEYETEYFVFLFLTNWLKEWGEGHIHVHYQAHKAVG